jgi:FKBP-type peptidyl-prolyl cis-trans isomerase
MKHSLPTIAVAKVLPLLAVMAIAGCNQQPASEAPALESQQQKLSYMMGFTTGSQLQSSGVEVDLASFTAGISAGQAGGEPALSEEQIAEVIATFESEMAAQQQQAAADQEAAMAAQSAVNSEASAAFLAAKAAEEGVVTTASGLQYKVIQPGSGAQPNADSTVEVHYEGRLIDGTVFDSSRQRGATASFGVTQVIPGWTEALQLMSVGAIWELYIPAELAYGPAGTPGGPIGPNAALIFEVELIAVDAAE